MNKAKSLSSGYRFAVTLFWAKAQGEFKRMTRKLPAPCAQFTLAGISWRLHAVYAAFKMLTSLPQASL